MSFGTGLCVGGLVIVPAAAKVCADTGPFLFISHGGEIQRAIEELRENMHQLQLSLQLHGSIRKPFALDKGCHVLSRCRNGPEEMAIGHALSGSPGTEFRVAALDFGLGHVHQPVIQVLVDFAGAGLKLVGWDFP